MTNRLPEDNRDPIKERMDTVRQKVAGDVSKIVAEWAKAESLRQGIGVSEVQGAAALALIRLGWMFAAMSMGLSASRAMEAADYGQAQLGAAGVAWEKELRGEA